LPFRYISVETAPKMMGKPVRRKGVAVVVVVVVVSQ
jgi:hypothetical protein